MHDEELHNLYSSPNIMRVIKSRRIRWAENVAHTAKLNNLYKILVVKSNENRQLGKPRRRWEDNMKIGLKEIGCKDIDWIKLA
jgi:hypothetical protein